MNDFFAVTVELAGQFSAHRGGVDHNIVQFVLAGSAWTVLLAFSLYRQKKKHMLPHEEMLIWAFSFGLLREVFMLSMALLQSYGIIHNDVLHIFFPPLEHALLDYSMILLCSAYMRYLLDNQTLPRRYLVAGLTAVTLCYLATFIWWGKHIIADPTSKFGQTWCDWIFRINSSVFIAIALVVLFVNTRGWIRSTITTALVFFFLHEFLKIPDMALGEVYEAQITPFRHGLYLMAIPIIGFIYVREQLALQEKTEHALQQSESLYRSLVETIDYGVTLIDRDHRIIMANSAQGRMFMIDPEKLRGKFCFNEFEDQESHCENCPGEKAMTSGTMQEIETEKTRHDGTRMNLRIKAYPVFDPAGNVTSFIEVTEDITDRIRASEELQRIKHLESVGVLAGGIAHDFNNILASIYGFTDLAILKSGNDPIIDKELHQIRKASQRGKDLVQQILTLSRKQEENRQPIQISSVFKETLKLLRSTLPSSIIIHQEISSRATVLADTTQMHQLVMNLCTNAFQAMDRSTGEISITLHDISVNAAESLTDEFVLKPGNYVKLTVRDTGTGMDEETVKRIYEPYFTTKEVGKGTGLGLSVVHGIIKSHSGKISVTSQPGKGTTFTVYLPAAGIEAVPEHETGEQLTLRGEERVMVVDDEEDIRQSVQEYLSRFGYTVEVFTNGREALDAYLKAPTTWDIIVTDLTMPEMTGIDLAHEVRKEDSALPVILCSGYSETINNGDIANLSPCTFIQKPLPMNDLLKSVQGMLKKRPEPLHRSGSLPG